MGLTVCVAQERDQGRREKRLNRALVRFAFGCGSAFSRVGFGAVVGARVCLFSSGVGCSFVLKLHSAPKLKEACLNLIGQQRHAVHASGGLEALSKELLIEAMLKIPLSGGGS